MTTPSPERRYDRLVVFRGAALGSLLAVPATLANSAAAGDDGSEGVVAITFLAVLVGFVLAGVLAGREARAEPSRHAALAALVAFVPVEVLAVLGRLDRSAPIRLVPIVLHALLAAWTGSLGGLLGARRRASRPTTTIPQEGP